MINNRQHSTDFIAVFIRVSGLLFFIFGVLAVVFRMVQFWILGDPPLEILVQTDQFMALQGLPSLASAVFFLLGITALYLKQANQAGVFGLVSFLIAFFAVTLSTGAIWTYAFTAPPVAQAAPELLNSPGSRLIRAVLVSLGLGQLGWLLMGISAWRARVIPRWAVTVLLGSILLVVLMTPIANTQVTRFLYNLLLGAGPLAIGYVLWTDPSN